MKHSFLYALLLVLGSSAAFAFENPIWEFQSARATANAPALKKRVAALAPKDSALTWFAVPAMSDVMRLGDTFPEDGTHGGELVIVAAKGEFEPASFQLFPFKDFKDVTIEVKDCAIPVDVKIVKLWFQNGNAWVSYFADVGLKLTPELLLHDENLIRVDKNPKAPANYARVGDKEVWISAPRELDTGFDAFTEGFADAKTLQPFALAKNEFKQFFVTAHVPENAAEGVYSGTVVVKAAEGELLAEIPLKVRVLPFALPAPAACDDIDKPMIISFMGEARGRDGLKSMREHGVTHLGVGRTPERIAMLRELGFTMRPALGDSFCPWFGLNFGGRMNFNTKVQAKLHADEAAAFYRKHLGHTDVLFGHGDEQGAAFVVAHREWYNYFHDYGMRPGQAGHGALMYKAGYTMGLRPIASNPDDISRIKPINDVARDVYAGFYACQHNGSENPQFVRRQHGLLGWFSGLTLVYNYEFAIGPWNDLANDLYKPMVVAYQNAGGVVDTLAYEGFREAADDIRYGTYLKQLCAAAIATADTDTALLARQATQWLALLKPDTMDLNEVRGEMIEHILKLMARGVKPLPGAGADAAKAEAYSAEARRTTDPNAKSDFRFAKVRATLPEPPTFTNAVDGAALAKKLNGDNFSDPFGAYRNDGILQAAAIYKAIYECPTNTPAQKLNAVKECTECLLNATMDYVGACEFADGAQIADLDPSQAAELVLFRANLRARIGDNEGALKVIESADVSANGNAINALIDWLYKVRGTAAAQAAAEKYGRLNNDFARGDFFAKYGSWEKAAEIFTAIVKDEKANIRTRGDALNRIVEHEMNAKNVTLESFVAKCEPLIDLLIAAGNTSWERGGALENGWRFKKSELGKCKGSRDWFIKKWNKPAEVAKSDAPADDAPQHAKLLANARAAFRSGDYKKARKIFAERDKLLLDRSHRTADCLFIKDAPQGIADILASDLYKSQLGKHMMDRPYGSNLAALIETDSNVTKDRQINEKGNEQSSAQFITFCDEDGVKILLISSRSTAGWEAYLAVDPEQPYACIMGSGVPGSGVSGDFVTAYPHPIPGISYEQRKLPGGGALLVSIPWSSLGTSERLNFDAIWWERGGLSWGGSPSVHNRSAFGDILIKGVDPKLRADALAAAEKRALAKARSARDNGPLERWMDPILGDRDFYFECLAPIDWETTSISRLPLIRRNYLDRKRITELSK